MASKAGIARLPRPLASSNCSSNPATAPPISATAAASLRSSARARAVRLPISRLFQQVRHQPWNGQVDADAGQADHRQGLDGGQNDLGIGLGRVMADQLDPGLGDLALRLQLRAAHPQALAGIGQPQRARRAGQPRGRQPRDLRGGVGAQAHHALAVRVHQPEGLLGRRGAGARKQAVLEFQQRRFDPLIPVRREAIHDGFDGACLQLRLGRQNIAQAGGQQGGVGQRGFVHGNRYSGAAL